MSVSQKVSESALIFMVHLYIALNRTGIFRITVNNSGKLHVSLVVSTWASIVSTWIPYFDIVCGSKYIAFAIVQRLNDLRAPSSGATTIEIVQLAYKMNEAAYKLNLDQKLSALSLTEEAKIDVSSITFQENTTPLTISFFLGFFLGDGYATVRIRLTAKGVIIIPRVIISQSLLQLIQY